MHSMRLVGFRVDFGVEELDESIRSEIEESLVRNLFVAAGQTARRAQNMHGVDLTIDLESLELERA
jgi:hypothetical protein